LPQLYQWEVSLQKDGTHREKLSYISEYVWKNSEMLTTKTKLFIQNEIVLWALSIKNKIIKSRKGK